MDDEIKDFKKNKPQQKIYKPGSGPLKRSDYGIEYNMETYSSEDVPRYNMKPSYRESTATRQRKPQQQLYIARSYDNVNERNSSNVGIDNTSQQFSRKPPDNSNNPRSHYRRANNRRDMSCSELMNKDSNNDHNYNRNYRQVSEPRSMTPTKTMQDLTLNDRNRDTRSMETSAGRHAAMAGGKPPTGRRNSAGYSSDFSRHKYTFNIDNLPPRLKRKYLEQAGQQPNSFDSSDQMYREQQGMVQPAPGYHQSASLINTCGWSQTLPSRGRGRLRDNESFDKEKFINTYLKTYEAHNSRRSTPSSSCMNLYEPDSGSQTGFSQEILQQKELNSDLNNGVERRNHTYDKNTVTKKCESDSETTSYSSPNLMDMTNLDWTEEVEKNIKLDDLGDSTGSSPSLNINSTSYSLDNKPSEVKSAELKEPKRRSRRRDKRSSSRGQRNEKRGEKGKKDAILPNQSQSSNNIRHERERKDSHRSNLSSTIGNSRDDLDKWRSLRSFSREHSTEGRLVSQCNSRDTSLSRMINARDSDGFRIPSSNFGQKKPGEVWSVARPSSIDRRRESPMRGGSASRDSGSTVTDAPSGGGRKSKRKGRRRGGRNNDSANRNTESMGRNSETPIRHEQNIHAMAPNHTTSSSNWREEIIESKKINERHHGSNRSRLNSTQSDKSVVESGPHPGLLILPQGTSHKEKGREGSIETQKTLFDHQNPSKPIVVQTNNARLDSRMERGVSERGGVSGGGAAERAMRHRALLQEVDRADALLQAHSLRGPLVLLHHWPDVADTRKFLQNALQRLLMSDLKYCQSDNTEHHFWKILYYNFIEISRKHVSQAPEEDKVKIKQLINTIIEEGNSYFEQLVQTLEKTYKFNVDDFINDNHSLPPKGLGYVGLALISVQKLYVFLGDLARYKEQVNETNNYAKSKYWYTKAQQINPKNGRPYNQLAILAIYARRKLDAVYYYMRSLMSSNPFHSARESLISLFDENRKKYEAAAKKRLALSAGSGGAGAGAGEGARGAREGAGGAVWIRPVAGPDLAGALADMSPVELNKNFITSYLYVHGKLVTKIGMETFEESAALMLRQFRALLNQQPLPTPAARLLQLTALNMFAVETTANASQKGTDVVARCTWVECALRVALLMFGALLDRCCALLPHPPNTQQHADALLLLPAIKVWSDWMLCHSSIWNPPPPLKKFGTESTCDPWELLAKLMNILETIDDKSIVFESEMKEDAVCVRLPEDSALAGFTPLMYMEPAPAYVSVPPASTSISPHHAEHVLRTRKLLFFGTEYLVGVEPPVIKMEFPEDGPPRYVSAVLPPPPTHQLQDLCEDSEEEYKEEEECKEEKQVLDGVVESSEADEATQRLLRRKQQLEARRDNLQRRNQRMQEIVGESEGVVVRPRWLVPDTNCFIDHLHLLQRIVAAPHQPYHLVVPLVVMSELEGLRLCARVGPLAESARRWAGTERGVRVCTAQGSLLPSRSFTAEAARPLINDDTVLATAAALLRTHTTHDGALEVVLLTEDRALRVKALAAGVPTRDLPSFLVWAGLEHDTNQKTPSSTDGIPSTKK